MFPEYKDQSHLTEDHFWCKAEFENQHLYLVIVVGCIRWVRSLDAVSNSTKWVVSWQLCSVCLFQLVACSGSMPSNISWRPNSFRPAGLLFSWERNHQNVLDSFYTIRAVRHVSTNESTSLLFAIQSEGSDYTRSSALPPACPIVLCDCPGSEEMILM